MLHGSPARPRWMELIRQGRGGDTQEEGKAIPLFCERVIYRRCASRYYKVAVTPF